VERVLSFLELLRAPISFDFSLGGAAGLIMMTERVMFDEGPFEQ
jgi:hypothetical protein